MASIIPDYEYDIFISYRHNDNLDGWVSDFVLNLEKELRGTIKQPISVYFDTNPNDGLLETQSVEKSLEGKLKCLIFIPIISQTYCDSKSYAWQHEFCAYNKLSNEDQFGRDIILSNGNVASRILPVKIHDIDKEDASLLESELGSVLRGIEFIFKSPGVNRPLTFSDKREESSNKTFYRDQINKVANAVNEIIKSLKNKEIIITDSGSNQSQLSQTMKLPFRKKLAGRRPFTRSIFITLLLAAAAALFLLFTMTSRTLSSSSVSKVEKSIAVLPFKNLSNNPEQQYFSDGMMEEILNHLFMIGGLKIPSGTSSMRFKGSNLSVREIATELKVSYVLEGNVSRSGDNVRIIVRLINGKNEQTLWTDDYKRSLTAINLLDIQSDVALQVAANLKIIIDPEVRRRINARPTLNTEAYTMFLQARSIWIDSYQKATQLLQNAVFLDPGFADAYAEMAYERMWYMDDTLSREQILEKVEPLLIKAMELDNNSIMAHSTLAEVKMWYYWDLETVEKEFQIVRQLNPSNTDVLSRFYIYLWTVGKAHEAYTICSDNFELNKTTAYSWIFMAMAYSNIGEKEKALETIETGLRLFPHNVNVIRNALRIFVELGNYDKAINLFEKELSEKDLRDLQAEILGPVGIAYYNTGNKSKSTEILTELLSRNRNFARNEASFSAAQIYVAMGEKGKALQCLEQSYTRHEMSLVVLKTDPEFKLLHGDPRFENLLLKIGFK